MKMRNIIEENPLLAILRNVPPDKTLPYVQTAVEAGVLFFEVALNSEHALQQIAMLKEHFGDSIYLGAGTATTVLRAEAAIKEGAGFLLSPSTDEPVLQYCREQQVDILPGVLTPSDVSKCLSYGFTMLKLFPAGDMPPQYIKSLKGPLDEADFIAIGGVTPANIQSFFEAGFLGVGMGSNLMPKEIVEQGQWAKGTAYIARLLDRIKEGKEQR